MIRDSAHGSGQECATILQIAFDFEGICTDLAPCINTGTSVSFRPAVGTIAPCLRDGITQLMSVIALFAEISVLSTKHDPDVAAWLKSAGLHSFVSAIRAESDHLPAYSAQQYHIRVATCDENYRNGRVSDTRSVIYWCNQSWREMLQCLMRMVADYSPTLRSDMDFRIIHAEDVSDRSPAPVWILTGADGSHRKLRVCYDHAMCERICTFLRLTQAHAYPHVARLLDVSGLAIVKSYIPGKPIGMDTEQTSRQALARKIGAALARLHEIPAPVIGFADVSGVPPQQLLICGADNYNTIVMPDGDVAFIDIEACRGGSRWIDLIWAEELFCLSNSEQDALYEGYYAVWGGDPLTETERQYATQEYLRWLALQLNRILADRPDTPGVLTDLNQVQHRLQLKAD